MTINLVVNIVVFFKNPTNVALPLGFYAYLTLTICKKTVNVDKEDSGYLSGFRRCYDVVGFVSYNIITIEIPT
jgi:hypothetical protein